LGQRPCLSRRQSSCWEAIQNNINTFAGSFDRWLRCSLVTDPGYAPRSRLASGQNPGAPVVHVILNSLLASDSPDSRNQLWGGYAPFSQCRQGNSTLPKGVLERRVLRAGAGEAQAGCLLHGRTGCSARSPGRGVPGCCPRARTETHPPSPLPCARSAREGKWCLVALDARRRLRLRCAPAGLALRSRKEITFTI
jgi:hypothetical protein